MENILKNLMRFSTTIDDENEVDCACYIADELKRRGIPAKIYEPTPGRGSVTARLEGREKETVILHGHLDTAPYLAEAGWKFPPDRATVYRDVICGRGALDCKGLVAIWIKLLEELALLQREGKLQKSVLFVAAAGEETGGTVGTGWLMEHTALFQDAVVAFGEGGGYPLPAGKSLYYTLQTGEYTQEERRTDGDYSEDRIREILERGMKKGYYSDETVAYCLKEHDKGKRRLDQKSLYEGMEAYLDALPRTDVLTHYHDVCEEALTEVVSNARLLPVITPGYSDNRYFRDRGIETIGFFPLDEKNAIGGIHGVNEYISRKSLSIAYRTLKKIIFKIVLTDEKNVIYSTS